MAWSLRKPAPDSYASVSSRDASDSGVRVTVRPQSSAPVDEVDPFGTTRIFELSDPSSAYAEEEDEVTRLDIVLRDPPTEPHLAVADPFELVERPTAVVAFRDDRETTLCSSGVERVSEVPVSRQAETVRLPRRRGWFASLAAWLRGLFVTRTAA